MAESPLPHPHDAAAGTAPDPSLAFLARSHTTLPARLATQEHELGQIVSLGTGNHTASVRLLGSQASVIGPVRVSLALTAVAAVGQTALVFLPDAANPGEAIVTALVS